MARKRTLNRSDLRAQSEAAEARETDKDKDDDAAEEEVEDDAGDDDAGDDDEGGAKKKAKVKAKAAPKKKAAPRKKAVKEVRMRAVWVVFDNGSKRLKEFAFAQKAEAEKYMAERAEEKKGTYYIQLVKEPLDS